MFAIAEVFKQERHSFNIYNHMLSLEELDDVISNLLFDNKVLTYLFTSVSKTKENIRDRTLMLRRFIPEEFYNREKEVLRNWDIEKETIFKEMRKHKGYYSFFAEALMAYLNWIYLDNKLTFGVISVDETLSDQHTGVDSCMYSDKNILLGEAKFYQSFSEARDKIIDDFNNDSIMNKIRSLYRKTMQSDIIIKGINEIETKLTFTDFMKKDLTLSGFILHNKNTRYEYSHITNVTQKGKAKNYNIVFYHLPINDKKELILKIIKKAVELINDGTK